MTELFRSIAAEQLVAWVFAELDGRDSIFGIPRAHFFVPAVTQPYRSSVFGQPLETPVGPAAGPHTQMAQNIVAAWLCGARYIELKTVQTLDELDVSKPCIDMQDEGYNIEWSQELKVYESFDEYLRAWVLIHALHDKLGFPGDAPGIVFNLSVGYDLAGVQRPNVQWFLDQVADCSAYKEAIVAEVARFHPAVLDLEIPDRLSDNVTLSTMHGCPPDEIQSISAYLLRERGLHTLVKLNPTLLGPGRVRAILNDDLNFADVTVPDAAFEHDLAYADAVPMLRNLQSVAVDCGLEFGVKLTNTLEVENVRTVFAESEKTSYLSGRPLHAISVNLAASLAEVFDGTLPMSFSAGANCFNVPQLLAAGMQTVTTCSDLLKTGGYMRLLDYFGNLDAAFASAGAARIDEYILATADGERDVRAAALANLCRYANEVRGHADYTKGNFAATHTKTDRPLERFDCISAPCVDECPLNQQVPAYMSAVRDGSIRRAREIVDADNPLPCVLGRICDHQCENVCVRAHLDDPLAIRDVKRFITDAVPARKWRKNGAKSQQKVAIIGAGPGGMAAALELAHAGCHVEVFEQQSYAGGMVGGVVPEYRLPRAVFERDFKALTDLGIDVHFGVSAGRDVTLTGLRKDGFDAIVLAVGAQAGKRLELEGEDCNGVIDALQFLRLSREQEPVDIGRRVGVIGAGDTAMDCARTAARYPDTEVTLIYRRSIDQMPADPEEIEQLLEEGVEVLEFAQPVRVIANDGNLCGAVCRRTRFTGDRDASGRKVPHEVPGSDFEIPLDSMILAISQQPVLDFFDGDQIELNERGYIATDPDTFETSVPGIYAGGDVSNEGPASIVKAAAAGKAIANSILGRRDEEAVATTAQPDVARLLRHRSHRQRRVTARTTPVASRDRDTEVMLTYSETDARAEASRCLDCDAYCSICAGVCPNLAVQTYRSKSADRQSFQVAVIADLCNECGNCTTFCPTAGQPYRDKPRLYLNRKDFEEQSDNAYLVTKHGNSWHMDARYGGSTRHIEFEDATGDDPIDAEMHVLLEGLVDSLPFLPAMNAAADASKIRHPGYED